MAQEIIMKMSTVCMNVCMGREKEAIYKATVAKYEHLGNLRKGNAEILLIDLYNFPYT